MSAVATAVAVARERGFSVEEPIVLREAWHVLVHLRPLPIVARVSTTLPFPEGPKQEDVVRELEVAGHAARRGAPVIPPVDDLAHRHGGHIVTFWRYLEPRDDPDPRTAGRALRAVHDALEDYDAPLPPTAHVDEWEEMLAFAGESLGTDVIHRVLADFRDLDGQALHGDAHLGNVLGTRHGPLWHDFETACRGPREYDLAALIAADRVQGDDPAARAALDAYGTHDVALLDELLPFYVAWVTASMLTALPRRAELVDAIDTRVRWLSRR